MSTLLGHLQEKLGAIDTWPTLILRKLFGEEEDLSPGSVAILASFFYGNMIHMNVAVPFCALCIGHGRFWVLEIMTGLFLKWQASVYTPYQTIYYDMVVRRHLFINGSACAETRKPLPFGLCDVPIPLGFECLGGRTEAIEGKLRVAVETPC
jgi:hypothetical protein